MNAFVSHTVKIISGKTLFAVFPESMIPAHMVRAEKLVVMGCHYYWACISSVPVSHNGEDYRGGKLKIKVIQMHHVQHLGWKMHVLVQLCN